MICTSEWLKRHCISIIRCKQAHAFLLRTGLFHDNRYISKILSFLASSSTSPSGSGSFSYASNIFVHLANPDAYIWNTMIRGASRTSDPITAVSYYKLMIDAGVKPDHHTYTFAVTACALSQAPEMGRSFHATALRVGLQSDVFVHNSLMRLYADCGRLEDAHQLFVGGAVRDVVSWNVMIGGFVRGGLHERAFDLFDAMLDGDVVPDEVTMISLASACTRLGDLGKGRVLHAYIKDVGLDAGNIRLANAVLDMYCKCGDVASARIAFREMRDTDVLTYTIMISGLAWSGRFQESLDLFREMQNDNVRPDEVAFVAVLSACSQMGALDQGKYLHHLIERHAARHDVVLGTALVDMYAKCGRVDLALQVFRNTRERNVFTWNAMICGYAMHGRGRDALGLFERMRHEGTVFPDDVTFIGTLSACSHSGLVDEGLRHFNLLREAYRIEPRMEHYGCVVDLLCRAGLTRDALSFVENMPVEPSVVLWASVLGACGRQGDAELAERVGRRVLELESDSCDRYVMLSNLYAGARRWNDAMDLRDLMKSKGMQKAPGVSWIEVDGTSHQFVAGDKSHAQTVEIYMMVEEMIRRVRSAGHVWGTSEILFDIEEEEKEHSLHLHSEKLAVAFGLMSSLPGSPLRIVKNLRVCNDCHDFLKAVSKVYGREIVARDRSRFHHFAEGSCSCLDYW